MVDGSGQSTLLRFERDANKECGGRETTGRRESLAHLSVCHKKSRGFLITHGDISLAERWVVGLIGDSSHCSRAVRV
jgi:hypothetical protein